MDPWMMKILQAVRTTWTNINTGEDEKYGIKVRIEGQKGWLHCARDGEALWFDDPKERDEHLQEIKKKHGV